MQFRTELTPAKAPFNITHADKVFTIGSCFSQVMGHRLAGYKFRVLNNLFGTVYNPLSIFRLLTAGAASFDKLYVERDGVWYNYLCHSSIKALSKEALQQQVAGLIKQRDEFLAQANYIIVTLGTAWYHGLKAEKDIVTNCHKMPGTLFDRMLAGIDLTNDGVSTSISVLQADNPGLKIILSVSPVRHTKETLEGNSISKAILRLLAYKLVEENDNVYYFPAYEIMMDDLRDYRFYADDLIHPTAMAEEYIWQKFSETYFSKETRHLNQEIAEIQAALNHRPFNPDSESHRKFQEKLDARIAAISPLVKF